MTEAEKLAKQWQRQFGNKQPPKYQDRMPGQINKTQVIEVPPERIDRQRAPESGLSDYQRYAMRITDGTVVKGDDGELYVCAEGLPLISLQQSDVVYMVGDNVDVLTIRQTASFSQYKILGRRKSGTEVINNE